MKLVILIFVVALTYANIRVDLSRFEKEKIPSEYLRLISDTISIEDPKIKEIEDLLEFSTGLGNVRVQLTNFRNLQYYGPLYLGSKRKRLNFVYDTGSSWLWFPGTSCTGCPTDYEYDPSKSEFYTDFNKSKELFYGKGYVKGKVIQDNVAMMGIDSESVPVKMLEVFEAKDLAGTQADGILGLSPKSSDSDLLVNKLAEMNVIDKREFTVYIAPQEDTSFIDFGEYKGDLTNITWAKLDKDTNYWSVPFNYISYMNEPLSLTSTSAVLDTGTSILGFPSTDLAQIIIGIKGEKKLYYFEEIGLYGVL
mmetsp:Transcript_31974/g.31367  ORF Transcript_31974/g.31367 Transcript_31974/m.31367 type:complete len:308 (-) Transcript_31974:145-1068(-)